MKKLILISLVPALVLGLVSCAEEPVATQTTTTTTHETVTQPAATQTTTTRATSGGY